MLECDFAGVLVVNAGAQPSGNTARDAGEVRGLKVNGTPFEVLILRPGRLASFDAMLDLLGGRSARNELTVIGDDTTVYGAEANLGPRGLVNSLGCGAASVPLASLRVREDFKLKAPRLVSSPQSVRYVCSFAANPNAHDSVQESYALRTDFTAFTNLWLGYDGIVKDFWKEQKREWTRWESASAWENFISFRLYGPMPTAANLPGLSTSRAR